MNSNRVFIIVVNAIAGGVAAAIPIVLFDLLKRSKPGYIPDGLGGLALFITLALAIITGVLGGGIMGALGRGIYMVKLASILKVALGASVGAVTGAYIGKLVFGIGNAEEVILVLSAELIGMILLMEVVSEHKKRGYDAETDA